MRCSVAIRLFWMYTLHWYQFWSVGLKGLKSYFYSFTENSADPVRHRITWDRLIWVKTDIVCVCEREREREREKERERESFPDTNALTLFDV